MRLVHQHAPTYVIASNLHGAAAGWLNIIVIFPREVKEATTKLIGDCTFLL